MTAIFDIECRRCDRLASFLDRVKTEHPDYHCRPVAPFGPEETKLLIVGLAPGMHGANRTGRPFTGDFAGLLLYDTLFKLGLASSAQPLDATGQSNPKMTLRQVRITNAVKCLPPANKPLPAEVLRCNDYLQHEIALLPGLRVIVALGAIAHVAVVRALGGKPARVAFGHGARHELAGRVVFDSYHCSRYNTQTRRLTVAMFEDLMRRAATESRAT